MSKKILKDINEETSNSNIIQLEDLMKEIKTVRENQDMLLGLLHSIAESQKCKDCLRNMYKECNRYSELKTARQQAQPFSPSPSTSKEGQSNSHEKSSKSSSKVLLYMTPTMKARSNDFTATTPTMKAESNEYTAVTPTLKPGSSDYAATTPTRKPGGNAKTSEDDRNQIHMLEKDSNDTPEVPDSISLQDEEQEVSSQGEHSVNQENMSGDDLAFVGEAKYGVNIKALDLKRCEDSSNNADKLALNLLEFLLTKEDCRDMTVYGYGGKKKAMDVKVRRAIKSHIFSIYKKEVTEEKKAKYWNETVVYKMNDKIRGIRNGKYKSKD